MATNPTIQFKRKTTSGIPASLSIGEPAINTADNQLFVGVNSNGVKWVGAEIENSSTNGTTWTSDLKIATKKAIGDYFAPLSGATFTGDVYLDNNKEIRLYEADANGSNYIAITTSSAITSNITYTLPEAPGANGYVLSSTTGGTLSWISAGTASSVSVTETGNSASYNLVFTDATSTTSASFYIDSSDNITFNPSTDTLAISGDLAVNGGDITTTSTGTATVFNTNATTVNMAGAGTTVSIGAATGTTTINNANTVVTGDLAVNGGDITSSASTFNLLTTTVSTMNIGGSGTINILGNADVSGTKTLNLATNGLTGSTTNVNIGSNEAGTTTINSATLAGSALSSTQNVFNTSHTTVNAFGAATALTMGATSGATTTIRGGTLVGNTTTQNLFNTTATTLNIGGAGTTVSIGAATGTTTINNANTVVTGDLAVNGGDITTTSTGTATVFNTNATTLNVGGAATALTMGATSGTAHIRNASLILGNTTNTITTITAAGTNHLTIAPFGDIVLSPSSTAIPFNDGTFPSVTVHPGVGATVDFNGGDIYLGTKSTDDITPVTTQVNLIWEGVTNNGFETTLTVADPTADQTITLPNATGTVALVAGSDTQVMFNDGGSALGGDSGLTYNKTTDSLTITGDLAVNGGDITTSATTFNLLNTTATTLNIGGAGTTVSIGAATGTTTINNANTVVTGDLAVNGGDITSSATTFNLLNSTVTSLNIGGAATTSNLGYTGTNASSTTNLAVGDVDVSVSKTINIGTQTTTNIALGSSLTVNIGSPYTATCAVNINGDVDRTAGITQNLFNTPTTVNFAQAATNISMGATSGATTTIRGGTLVGNTTTQNLFNTTATTLNIGGAATTVTIGASTATINLGGGTTGASVVIKGNLQVDGTTTTVNSTTVTIDDLNIVLADGVSAAASADGGGINLGTTGITWTYLHSATSWSSTQNINVATGKTYKINSVDVLTATSLGSTVTGSSLTSVGTIGTGVWNGTTIGVAYGGTGLTTYTTGQILYASASSTLAGLTASSTAGAVVASTGAGAAPEYKTISVTNGSVTSGSGTLTLAIQDAAANGSTKGLAAFNSTQFDDASGVITLDTIDGGTYA